jgi:hypothetical protein
MRTTSIGGACPHSATRQRGYQADERHLFAIDGCIEQVVNGPQPRRHWMTLDRWLRG